MDGEAPLLAPRALWVEAEAAGAGMEETSEASEATDMLSSSGAGAACLGGNHLFLKTSSERTMKIERICPASLGLTLRVMGSISAGVNLQGSFVTAST